MKPGNWIGVICALCVFISTPLFGETGNAVHHDIQLTLDPASHRIEVVDRITLADDGPATVLLHQGLKVVALDGRLTPKPTAFDDGVGVPVNGYEVTPVPGERTVTLRYSGAIYHPAPADGSETPGMVDAEGVYLAATSAWYPVALDRRVTFNLEVALPPGWKAVSQGARVARHESGAGNRVTWRESAPQEEIYLIAATFTEYEKNAGAVQALAYLRKPDAALAARYLDVTAQYIEMYHQLIGPYPYGKFALVENFRQTGYGMPSFTLLGSRVIRLPFILHSSYPHEILHNWWGNGVYVDYAAGNWAEGLTSYLADHLIQEQRGEGAVFRRNILQGYADFVREGRDFPLTEFRARHSSSSEAIGYGKTQMVFHMLRRELGDEKFIKGLQRLYADNQFRTAGFAEVEQAFSQAGRQDLSGFFRHWTQRVGAPELRLKDVASARAATGWRVSGVLEQVQPGEAYPLTVPMALTLEGRTAAYETRVAMSGKRQPFVVELSARPLRLDVDPQFDVFRRLDRAEIPPALSQAFGADRGLVVLPAEAPPALLEAYRGLARTWGRFQPQAMEMVMDDQLAELPSDQAVWVLGWENRFRDAVTGGLADQPFKLSADGASLENKSYSRNHSLVVTARAHADAANAMVWVATDNVAAVPGLGRKLPHYRKYSYLAFQGDAPENVAKGQWLVGTSPMIERLGESAVAPAALAPRPALARLPEVTSERR